MAKVSTRTRGVVNKIGDQKFTHGTYISTAGEVHTGLAICDFLRLQGTASAISDAGSAAVVNASMPRSGTAVPIVSNGTGGLWYAYGR